MFRWRYIGIAKNERRRKSVMRQENDMENGNYDNANSGFLGELFWGLLFPILMLVWIWVSFSLTATQTFLISALFIIFYYLCVYTFRLSNMVFKEITKITKWLDKDDEDINVIQAMKNELTHLIKTKNDFDGTYYEVFLKNCVQLNKNDEVIRVMVTEDDDILVHIMNQEDESSFEKFDNLGLKKQIEVYLNTIKAYL